MPKANPATEVIVSGPNAVGTLAKVSSVLAEAKVNIDACCCYTEDGKICNLHFITSDPGKAVDACRKSGWATKTNESVCCELANTVGALASATTKLSGAGVDIRYCYCSTGNGNNTKVFFCTSDNAKAVKVLG